MTFVSLVYLAYSIPGLVDLHVSSIPGLVDLHVSSIPGLVDLRVSCIPGLVDLLVSSIHGLVDLHVSCTPSLVELHVSCIPGLVDLRVLCIPDLPEYCQGHLSLHTSPPSLDSYTPRMLSITYVIQPMNFGRIYRVFIKCCLFALIGAPCFDTSNKKNEIRLKIFHQQLVVGH